MTSDPPPSTGDIPTDTSDVPAAVPAAAGESPPVKPAVPRVAVVIPTYHRPALLQRCLRAVLAQALPAGEVEVIVVDDGCSDDTQALVAGLAAASPHGPVLRYQRPAGEHGPSIARNLGWRSASAPVIAFTDDDTVPAPDWLARGLAAMARPDARGQRPAALGGRVQVPLSPRERRWPTDHQRMTLGLETAEFVTANAFVRRAALLQVGGFDERFRRAWREDTDLQFRLQQQAGPVLRCEDAVVAHPVRPEPWGVCLRQQRNTFFDALLYKKHPQLYRERVRRVPPWPYYIIVAATTGAWVCAIAGQRTAALGLLLIALGHIGWFAWQRLREAARDPRHVMEMLVTSAAIPFLSVYWRLRGAWRFRVLFL